MKEGFSGANRDLDGRIPIKKKGIAAGTRTEKS